MRTRSWCFAAVLAIGLAAFALLGRATVRVPDMSAQERDFEVDNRRAMETMMADMDVAPSGNVDRDFVASMVPHHQGAIDMAVAELRFGKDERLRRLAQEIVVEQQQEIAVMQLAARALPAAVPDPAPTADRCARKPIPHSSRATAP